MIKQGSLVRYKGENKRFWPGKLLMVYEVKGDSVTVWNEPKPNGKWTTATVNVKELEEVC